MLNFFILSQTSISLYTCRNIRYFNHNILYPISMVNKFAHLKLNSGDIIPDSILNIKLKTDDGLATSLKNVLNGLSTAYKGIVIFIYPIANTPGCTQQACNFKDNFENIKKEGFLVYGLSSDPPESQTKWKNKLNFQYTLLCDQNKELISALGCRIMGLFTTRSHLIIDRNGTLLHIERGVSAGQSTSSCIEFIKKYNNTTN